MTFFILMVDAEGVPASDSVSPKMAFLISRRVRITHH